MMELIYSNGAVFVYDVEEWITLRKTHRIVGALVGSTNFVPALPLKLIPEEVIFLIDQGIAKVIQYSISEPNKAQYDEFAKKLLVQQRVLHKEKRRRQLETMMDKIVEGKRRKGDERSSDIILKEELERSCGITEITLIWPTLLTPLPSNIQGEPSEIPRSVILTMTSELKCKVFADLWLKGYYITLGHKFGGHFLVYKEDPIIFHAMFIVRCVEEPDILRPTEIVTMGRLANSVKKRAVLASLHGNIVSYITISWMHAR